MKLKFWDILASLVVLAGLGLAVIFINIFLNPGSSLNPFPPPTLIASLPSNTLTVTPQSLPELWSATPETPGVPSAVVFSTFTQAATNTRFVLPTRTVTPYIYRTYTRTPNQTLTNYYAIRSATPTSTMHPCTLSGNNIYCDDANTTSIIYYGTWGTYSGGGPYAGTSHYTSTAGASITFPFYGSRVTYVYPTYHNRGHVDIYIDGIYSTRVNLYSPNLVWQNMWDSPILVNSSHSITIVVADGTVDADAFIINRLGAALTNTPGASLTRTPTRTATRTLTLVPVITGTNTATSTITLTPTHTSTGVIPPTATHTVTSTATTVIVPTSTNTVTLPAPATFTSTPTATIVIPPTGTSTSTATIVIPPTDTATATLTITPTNTLVSTSTATETLPPPPPPTDTVTPTDTLVVPPTSTITETLAATSTATITLTLPETPTLTHTPASFTISGNTGVGPTRTPTGEPVPAVSITVTGDPGAVITQPDGLGNYSVIVPANWSGKISPARIGYLFTPVYYTYTNVAANIPNQNFTSVPVATFTVSGNVGVVPGATVIADNGAVVVVQPELDGNYSVVVPSTWSGTIKPTHATCTYTPVKLDFTNTTGDLVNQNFAPACP